MALDKMNKYIIHHHNLILSSTRINFWNVKKKIDHIVILSPTRIEFECEKEKRKLTMVVWAFYIYFYPLMRILMCNNHVQDYIVKIVFIHIPSEYFQYLGFLACVHLLLWSHILLSHSPTHGHMQKHQKFLIFG